MTKDQVENVLFKIDNDGFDYCFRQYSSFEEISDLEFRKAYDEYVSAAQALEEHIRREAEKHGVEIEW
jgi:hypothetical protein